MRWTGTINLATSRTLPQEGYHTANGNLSSIQMATSGLSGATDFAVEVSLDGTGWDVARDNGTDITGQLTTGHTATAPYIESFEFNPGIYWRVNFGGSTTGVIPYVILD